MRPSTISGIRTIGVPVRDQAAAVRFYVGTLGFETRLDVPMGPSRRWIEVAPAGGTVSLALDGVEGGAAGPGTDTRVRFSVPDAAAEHDALRSKGVSVGDLLHLDGAPPMFTFDDPDGNRFYVVEATP